MRQQMGQKLDIDGRVARAQRLRATVTDPEALATCARELVDAAPKDCRHLVAFCAEGHAVAAAASALALGAGRSLSVHLASHVAPLDSGPAAPAAWQWMSVEEALGLGPVRQWVMRWAEQRGGARPLTPSRRPHLAQVA